MMSIKFAASIFLAACLASSTFGHFVGTPSNAGAANVSIVAEKYVRTELYFGLSRKGGSDVTEAEFQRFIDEIVTPRFPNGLTVLDARGQWREDDNTITKERSKVLILIYRRSERRSANMKIEAIRTEYKKRFSQQSVLRSDISKGLRVEF